MAINISNKAMLLTGYENVIQLIKDVLPEINIDQYSEKSSLTSLASLKQKLQEEGNISFLKKEILSFIQNEGYPFIIVLDMKINTGIEGDPEHVKVLKTLLISYIIILQSEQYKNISCNVLILMDKNEYNHFKNTHKHPQNFLSIIKTNDERLNSIISEYTINSEKFKRNFNILITNAEQEPSLIKSEFILFTNMIKAKEKLKNKLVQEKPVSNAGPKIEAAHPADLVLRIGDICFKNGDEPCKYDDRLNLDEKEIYILGNFTSYTRLDVIDRLLRLIKTGFGNDLNFKKGDPLIISIPNESVIDSTTPITLAQLLSKELQDYKNVRIKTSSEHYKTMQQSKGFSMIQRNVIIHDA